MAKQAAKKSNRSAAPLSGDVRTKAAAIARGRGQRATNADGGALAYAGRPQVFRVADDAIEIGQTPEQSEVAVAQLWALLRSPDETTANTSMRLPVVLRDAAHLAVRDLGAADSTTSLTADALRTMLEAVAMRTALDAHYSTYPQARPSLAQVALAAARVDRNPLADQPGILEAAAAQIVLLRPDADADDVLLWAEAQQKVSHE